MIQKKVVLIGAPGVGKTSLVRRFVESAFDDKYLTTIGVKVDKRVMTHRGQDVTLMLWDIAGAEERFSVPVSYLRGAAGYLLVSDGTRADTLDVAFDIVDQITRELPPMPGVLVLNKSDLVDAWQVSEADVSEKRAWQAPIVRASAKTGTGVEAAFAALVNALLPSST